MSLNIKKSTVVGLIACVKSIQNETQYAVIADYVEAVAEVSGCLPLIIPALADRLDIDRLLSVIDGLLLTGSLSNVQPHLYGGPEPPPGTLHDSERDATTLPLIRAAVIAQKPILAICRGVQELNVALGGTLHQAVHEVPGRMDHRANPDDPIEVQYAPVHDVELTEGGYLARLFGTDGITVNSTHSQGIDKLGDGLIVEALAPDGQIEAVRVEDHPSFAIGVQWHPETMIETDYFAKRLFSAFGEAGRESAEH